MSVSRTGRRCRCLGLSLAGSKSSAKAGNTVGSGSASRIDAAADNGGHLAVGQATEVVVHNGEPLLFGECGNGLGEIEVPFVYPAPTIYRRDLGDRHGASGGAAAHVDRLS